MLELPESLKKRYLDQASRCSIRFLYDALGITTACEAGYKLAVNPRLHIEFALMKLCFLMKAPENTSEPVVMASTTVRKSEVKNVAERSEASETHRPSGQTAEPRERKKPAKSGSSLSLNALLDEDKSKKEEKKAAPVSDELPEDEAILKAWAAIPDEFEAMNQTRLANTLKNATAEVETSDGRKTLTFKVSNEAQRKWIQDNRLLSLEGNLQKRVGSSRIRLEIGVIPMEEKEYQPYTDQEKATALMGRNGEVQNLVKDFGLETK